MRKNIGRMIDEETIIYSQLISLFYFSQEKKSYIYTHNIFYTHTGFKSIQKISVAVSICLDLVGKQQHAKQQSVS